MFTLLGEEWKSVTRYSQVDAGVQNAAVANTV